MTKRTKRILSLLLSSAMVFTMNTAAFAGEASLDNAIKEHYDEKAGKTVYDTQISYAEGTHKGVKDVVTIKNTTDPVSWNGAERNGRDLISTVLAGTDSQDEYLNNSKKKTASNNGGAYDIQGLHDEAYDAYDVIDLTGGNYLFVGYGLYDGFTANVETTDDFVTYGKEAEIYGENPRIPVIRWDGRAIDYDKSGLAKSTKGKNEALYVDIALVKYENGTVTEIPGVEVGSVKVDKKAVKQASVSGSAIKVEKEYKYWDDVNNAEKTEKNKDFLEYKIVNGATLPSFTVTAKVGKEVASQKKAIADALKAKTYQFAIAKGTVDVTASGTFAEGVYDSQMEEAKSALQQEIKELEEEIAYYDEQLSVLPTTITQLEEKIATETDETKKEELQKQLDEARRELNGGWNEETGEHEPPMVEKRNTAIREHDTLTNYYGLDYFLNNKDKFGFKPSLSANGIEKAIDSMSVYGTSGSQDEKLSWLGGIYLTKFNGKKATIAKRVEIGDNKKGFNKTADVVLKEKKDYTLETGTLAGETVTVLSFPETSNYEYKKSGVEVYQNNVNGLASLGYKYAFRVAPTNKKLFRTGVFKADNEGFVYSAE